MARTAAMEMGGKGGDRFGYEWEEKRNDDLWVMETLGNRMLSGAGHRAGAKAQDAQGPPAPAVAWRHKCTAEGFDPGCHCLCKRFDPVVMLPRSLFNEHEINREVHRAAMQLLEDAQGTIPGGFAKADLEMDVAEHVCHLNDLRCHAVCFRFRQRVRHLFVEGARSRAAERDLQGVDGEAATLQLDRWQFEANMYLLPELLHWAEQFRAVKGHAASQSFRNAQKKHEDQVEAEMRRTHMETRLRRFSITDLPGTAQHAEEMSLLALPPPGESADGKALALVPRQDTAKSCSCQASRTALPKTGSSATGRGMMTAPQAVSLLATRDGKGLGVDAPGKPVLCCRCGHSNVWHEEPESHKPKAPPVAPWLQKGKNGRSYYHRPSTPQGQSAVLAGGVLRKAGSMVSLQKL